MGAPILQVKDLHKTFIIGFMRKRVHAAISFVRDERAAEGEQATPEAP